MYLFTQLSYFLDLNAKYMWKQLRLILNLAPWILKWRPFFLNGSYIRHSGDITVYMSSLIYCQCIWNDLEEIKCDTILNCSHSSRWRLQMSFSQFGRVYFDSAIRFAWSSCQFIGKKLRTWISKIYVHTLKLIINIKRDCLYICLCV